MGSFFTLPKTSYKGSFLPLTKNEEDIKALLKTFIQILAVDIGVRNLAKKGTLQAAEQFILKEFGSLPFIGSMQLNSQTQNFTVNNTEVNNIILEKLGNEKPDEIIIIGAHYDTVMESPGADDNASGVAAILTFAHLLAQIPLTRTLRFVAFVNEEPPFFFTRNMGSYRYARLCKKKKENIVAMYSIESIGYYSIHPHTQAYPFPFKYIYPNTANFIGFVGNMFSHRLVKDSIELFRSNTSFPSEGIFAPLFIPGIGLSDQLPFWLQGIKAVMVTDTAYLRNPHYHTSLDLPNTLNFDFMARVVDGLAKMIIEIANR